MRDRQELIDAYFEEDGAPKLCPKCGSDTFTEKVIGIVDVFQGQGPACEVEFYCQCGDCVGFWAYGTFSPQCKDAFIANIGKEKE
jgi:hypothetical protein